jgi:hypothetical protein
LNRYGRQRVASWKVEIVASAQENSDSISRYCIFYQATYKICKELIPELSIGGATFIMTNSLELGQLLNDKLRIAPSILFVCTLPYSIIWCGKNALSAIPI